MTTKKTTKAKAATPPPQKPKPPKPTAKQNALLKKVQGLHDLTRDPHFQELARWVRFEIEEAKEACTTCKKADLERHQSLIRAYEGWQNRVIEPAEEFQGVPLFQQGWKASYTFDDGPLVTLERLK